MSLYGPNPRTSVVLNSIANLLLEDWPTRQQEVLPLENYIIVFILRKLVHKIGHVSLAISLPAPTKHITLILRRPLVQAYINMRDIAFR